MGKQITDSLTRVFASHKDGKMKRCVELTERA